MKSIWYSGTNRSLKSKLKACFICFVFFFFFCIVYLTENRFHETRGPSERSTIGKWRSNENRYSFQTRSLCVYLSTLTSPSKLLSPDEEESKLFREIKSRGWKTYRFPLLPSHPICHDELCRDQSLLSPTLVSGISDKQHVSLFSPARISTQAERNGDSGPRGRHQCIV